MTEKETPVFTLDGIRKFHGWTHASLSLLLDHLSSIPATDYAKVLPAIGLPTLREQVIHIFNCEGFWIHTLQGLLYVDREPEDLHRHFNTVEAPLNALGEAELCPGPEILDRYNAAHR